MIVTKVEFTVPNLKIQSVSDSPDGVRTLTFVAPIVRTIICLPLYIHHRTHSFIVRSSFGYVATTHYHFGHSRGFRVPLDNFSYLIVEFHDRLRQINSSQKLIIEIELES